jgi:glycosyltransferase involved in cell wall biosynthesis
LDVRGAERPPGAVVKVVVVSTFYSEGMGYSENCLPKAMAARGHDVTVVTSNWNVYGNTSDYERTYRAFLGPADQGTGQFQSDGYTVQRLPSRMVGAYVLLKGLTAAVRALRPAVVHSTEIASLQTFQLAAVWPVSGFRLFTETHQHLSVVQPYLKHRGGPIVRKVVYRMTRTLPTFLSSLAVERCYAISPDCMYVARTFYGVPGRKLKLQSLGTDTARFRPAATAEERAVRAEMRRRLGYSEDDIVCLYTGRLSHEKNPLVLAKAVDVLSEGKPPFRSLFIGEGSQKDAIAACAHAQIVPFMKHAELADFYRLADIAVWPRLESMSMLDAAASGLPLIVSAEMGESERVAGNGRVYRENSVEDLVSALASLASASERGTLGAAGRAKMIRRFSWDAIAQSIESDYLSLGCRSS